MNLKGLYLFLLMCEKNPKNMKLNIFVRTQNNIIKQDIRKQHVLDTHRRQL